MTTEDAVFAAILLIMLISALLYVLFGQVTVRKLRKNPETKRELGVELASGWDILNVAQALSLPKTVIRRMEKSPLYFLEADANTLYKHTNVFDRILARVFYWMFMTSGLSGAILGILSFFGLFD